MAVNIDKFDLTQNFNRFAIQFSKLMLIIAGIIVYVASFFLSRWAILEMDKQSSRSTAAQYAIWWFVPGINTVFGIMFGLGVLIDKLDENTRFFDWLYQRRKNRD